tara:strand:- start:24 stop:170 length:147 start_codon:yes stop_codon:yes gene_type:complete
MPMEMDDKLNLLLVAHPVKAIVVIRVIANFFIAGILYRILILKKFLRG